MDQIEGIGSIRKRALLNHFGSARAAESASLDEIKSVEGVEEKVAKKYIIFFTNENKNPKLSNHRKNNYCSNICNSILPSWFLWRLVTILPFLLSPLLQIF